MTPHELKRRREAIGATQKALGELAEITQPHLSQMEAGARAIGKRTARRLDAALIALEMEQAERAERVRACVDRVMGRPHLVALRDQYAQMPFDD